ncbi:hypothetical protein [Thermorudis peleae]|uniref:hypothetical protein n=1 Tax=Thermorudis peleae TaxID=1382356 RepID=UPI00056DB5F8|nr:hypothetical protein [Thermorudis peleae]
MSQSRPDRPAGLPPEADAPSPRRAERLLFFGLATLVAVILGVAVVGVLAAPRGGTTMTTPSATPDATPPTTPDASSPATPDATAPLLQVLAVTPEPVAPGQPVTLLVRVLLPDACTTPAAPRVERQGTRITVTLVGQRPADAICAQVVRETTVTVALGPLEAGEYQLIVNGTTHQLVVDSTTSGAGNASPGGVMNPPVRTTGTPEGSATSSGAVVSPTPQATAPPPGSVPATMPPATPIGGSSGGLAGLPTVVIVPPHSVQIPPATPSSGSTPDASPQ